ncbi:MAG TPA: Do family serine endopeptidase [Pirellulales bacterium]|nr:Do family serine endopeptidase [Pirellulales bacterium]
MERTLSSPRARNRTLAVLALLAMSAVGFNFWQSHGVAQEQVVAPSAATEHADHLSQAFRKAAEAAVPTVVTIETKIRASANAGNMKQFGKGENPFKGTPFEDFFNDDSSPFQFNTPHGGRSFGMPERQGMGSGVIIDKSGIILTNNHVVDGAGEVSVKLSDGREFKASDIKTDPETDLAVLRIQGAGSLPFARLGDSEKMQLGDWVIAVGNPFGLNSTVSAGIISGTGRELASSRRGSYIQTDAAINPGNSGGPLLNLRGEVIGINTAIASNSGGYQGIGFAIPSNQAKWVVSQLIKNGVVQRAYLGVAIREVSGELAEQLGVKGNEGVLVQEVNPGSPAEKAGFEAGDVITEYDGKAIKSPRELQALVERTPADAKEEVKVLRDGKPLALHVVVKPLETMQSSALAGAKRSDDDHPAQETNALGVAVSELTENNAEQLGFKGHKGVVITEVKPNSPAAEVGLREGMLIMKVGKQHVESVEDFQAAMKDVSLDKGVLLLVRTENGNRFVVLQRQDG